MLVRWTQALPGFEKGEFAMNSIPFPALRRNGKRGMNACLSHLPWLFPHHSNEQPRRRRSDDQSDDSIPKRACRPARPSFPPNPLHRRHRQEDAKPGDGHRSRCDRHQQQREPHNPLDDDEHTTHVHTVRAHPLAVPSARTVRAPRSVLSRETALARFEPAYRQPAHRSFAANCRNTISISVSDSATRFATCALL
jgi:hypothetical protein